MLLFFFFIYLDHKSGIILPINSIVSKVFARDHKSGLANVGDLSKQNGY